MQVVFAGDRARVSGVQLDLRLTLYDSAQVFHFVQSEEGYIGRCAGRDVRVQPTDGGFDLIGISEEDIPFFRDYLDLDRDYAGLLRTSTLHPVAAAAIERLPGLRILNQPPWEALFQFMLSANNNVARIRSLVMKLSSELGECGALGVPGIPSPEALAGAGEATLRNLGVGYRAPQLVEAARAVADGFPLDALAGMPLLEARQALTTLKGVGDKIAECVLLFGCRHANAFPVDVWVDRLMRGWFGENCNKRTMAERGRCLLGENAGLIQQYLFHCARLKLLNFHESGETL